MKGHQRAAIERVTVERLRARFAAPARLTTQAMLRIIMQQARRRAVPYDAYIAAHGILLGLTSTRCTAAVRSGIAAMTPDELLGLVAEVAATGGTIAAVPRYLNARVAQDLGAAA